MRGSFMKKLLSALTLSLALVANVEAKDENKIIKAIKNHPKLSALIAGSGVVGGSAAGIYFARNNSYVAPVIAKVQEYGQIAWTKTKNGASASNTFVMNHKVPVAAATVTATSATALLALLGDYIIRKENSVVGKLIAKETKKNA